MSAKARTQLLGICRGQRLHPLVAGEITELHLCALVDSMPPGPTSTRVTSPKGAETHFFFIFFFKCWQN